MTLPGSEYAATHCGSELILDVSHSVEEWELIVGGQGSGFAFLNKRQRSFVQKAGNVHEVL